MQRKDSVKMGVSLAAFSIVVVCITAYSSTRNLGMGTKIRGGRSAYVSQLHTHARKPSKRVREINEKLEDRAYKAVEAIQLMKQFANAKFTETAEMHANLNIDPRKATQNLRTTVVLPKGTGKTVKVAALCKEESVSDAKAAGADVAGFQDLIDDINAGKLDFDRLITTPDMMPQIARLGRVLGPKGLMPSIKSGTVTTDLPATIKEIKGGRLELRADKKGVVHIPFGKMDFSDEDLLENFLAIREVIEANKPSDIKKVYWKSAYVTSTMGPGIQLDLGALATKEYA